MSPTPQRARRPVENPARRPATPQEAKALAHPDRLRIIRLTYDTALTNKELAERMGRNPGTTLYHLRLLVETGFVAAEPPRKGNRGAAEVPYRSTGKSWTLDVGEPTDDLTTALGRSVPSGDPRVTAGHAAHESPRPASHTHATDRAGTAARSARRRGRIVEARTRR